jgi:hypothetical protein
MESVQIWNPNGVTLAAARMLEERVEVVERQKESICALRWHGGELVGPEWVGMEKYTWC